MALLLQTQISIECRAITLMLVVAWRMAAQLPAVCSCAIHKPGAWMYCCAGRWDTLAPGASMCVAEVPTLAVGAASSAGRAGTSGGVLLLPVPIGPVSVTCLAVALLLPVGMVPLPRSRLCHVVANMMSDVFGWPRCDHSVHAAHTSCMSRGT